jgi:hypothetical protein
LETNPVGGAMGAATRLGGNPRQHTRVMLAVWSLMRGTAMLIIRGEFEGVLRTQTIHACIDAFDGSLTRRRDPIVLVSRDRSGLRI